jgi:hypothetical protein
MTTLPQQSWTSKLWSWRSILLIILPFVAAVGLRLYIMMPLRRMPFNSDEALFLLMARHVLAGQRPLFMYGESYGGTIDSYLAALLFNFLGPTIIGGRLIQTLEYLIGMAFTYLLARRVLPDSRMGPVAVLWLMAVPPLMVSTWSTPTLRYSVVICLGSILSYLGHRLLKEDADKLSRWILFGLVCGLSFWTFGILVVYMLPLFILFLFQFRWRRWLSYLLAATAFFLASAPWWTQSLSGLSVIYNPSNPASIPPLLTRIFAFLTIMVPGFLGIRDPWAPDLTWPLLAPLVLFFYLAAFLYAVPRFRRNDEVAPTVETYGMVLLAFQALVWGVLYFSTRFSLDATGRYIFPLYPVFFIAAGLLLERLFRWRHAVAIAILTALLAFNLATHVRAVQSVPWGITAQMNPVFRFGNDSDQALIDFVSAHGGRGYSHHWISYKIAYLSDEQVILSSLLPYRTDLKRNLRDDRYAPYRTTVEASPTRVYVTHREPNLEDYLQRAFADRDISYQIKDIGPYRVYYDFSALVSPQEIGLIEPVD